MAGRKVFTSGEILTAADVNSFLMNQVVAVFADDAARSSAIPSPSEGMITYLEDTDAVEKFDGSAFVNVSPGGLVAVKSALKTDTFTASVAGGGNVAVTDLSITHEVSDPGNKLIISAFFGAAANADGNGQVGLAIHDGSGLIVVGDAAGSRTSVTAGAQIAGSSSVLNGSMPSVTYIYTPGSGSKTYTVRAVNIRAETQTLYVNRAETDTDDAFRYRAVSSIVIQEVAV